MQRPLETKETGRDSCDNLVIHLKLLFSVAMNRLNIIVHITVLIIYSHAGRGHTKPQMNNSWHIENTTIPTGQERPLETPRD